MEIINIILASASIIIGLATLYVSRNQILSLLKSKNVILKKDSEEWTDWAKHHLSKENEKFSVNFAKNAYFIDYSGNYAKDAIKHALHKGWIINLFIRHPNFENNEFQKNQITASIGSINTAFKKYIDSKKLIIKYYKQEASVRIRYFKGLFIHFSWYYYLPYKIREELDGNHIIGHNNLSFTICKNMEGWGEAKDYWDKYLEDFIKHTYTIEQIESTK